MPLIAKFHIKNGFEMKSSMVRGTYWIFLRVRSGLKDQVESSLRHSQCLQAGPLLSLNIFICEPESQSQASYLGDQTMPEM